MLSNIPSDPLPEIGDKIVRGATSLGIPKNEVTGDKSEHKVSNAPDALISSMEKINATSDGSTFRSIFNPSFAPVVNSLKTLTPLKIPCSIIITTITGIIKLLISVI
jgi:hypothetical protein